MNDEFDRAVRALIRDVQEACDVLRTDIVRHRIARKANFNPAEPRDEEGRWSGGMVGGINPSSANLVKPFDVDNAVKQLRINALSVSANRCAKYVANAIRSTGIKVNPPLARKESGFAEARDYRFSLEMAGFSEVTNSSQNAGDIFLFYKPQKGDVVIFQPVPKHEAGHIAMYDGQKWISDFVQKGFWPASAYKAYDASYAIYRHVNQKL